MTIRVDLNADMGESFGAWSMGNDEALLEVVTSANIACGFHAGDARVMDRTVAAAAAHGVRIGAHVGYRDLAGFGRRRMDYEASQLRAETLYQLGALAAIAATHRANLAYVKPHGALYNRIATDRYQADAVIAAMLDYHPQLPLMVLAGSPLEEWAREAGLTVIAEGFADRAYTPQGELVARSQPGAVHADAETAARQACDLAIHHAVTSIDGSRCAREVDSICVHGDNPQAVALAELIRRRLEEAGVEVGYGEQPS